MSRCAACGAHLTEGGLCPYHDAQRDGWAEGNRAACDFFHRRHLRPPERRSAIVAIARGLVLQHDPPPAKWTCIQCLAPVMPVCGFWPALCARCAVLVETRTQPMKEKANG